MDAHQGYDQKLMVAMSADRPARSGLRPGSLSKIGASVMRTPRETATGQRVGGRAFTCPLMAAPNDARSGPSQAIRDRPFLARGGNPRPDCRVRKRYAA